MKIKNFVLCVLAKLGLVKKAPLCEKLCKKSEVVAPAAKTKTAVSTKSAAKKPASTRKKP